MLNSEETAELRALQAKAFGRGGELSPDERTRLRALERQRRGTGAAAPAEAGAGEMPDPSTGSGSGSGTEVESGSGLNSANETEAASGHSAGGEGKPAPSVRRPRWRGTALAAVGTLLIGLVAGWMIWGWDSANSALVTAHSDQRAELESSGDFDPGSVVAVSEQHGIVVWQAERREGVEHCVIVTTSSQTQSGCAALEDDGLGAASVTTTVPDGDELAGQSFSVFLLRSASGEIVPTIQIWNSSDTSWEAQYTDAELEAITRLEAEGFSRGELNIIGHDGDTPVWGAWTAEGQCVIVEADAGIEYACVEQVSASAELTLTAEVNDMLTRYVVHNSDRRGQQLTIMRLSNPDAVDLGAELDDKTGK